MKPIRNFFVRLLDKIKSNHDTVIAISSVGFISLFFFYGFTTAILTILAVIFLWLGGEFTWWQYKNTKYAPEDIFEKEKVRLEVWLATFGALVVAGIFAGLQFLHDERIADRQDYRISIDFLSSGSPAVRQKGVEDLYEYAKENNNKAKEIWNILNDHVKYFTRDKSYQASFPGDTGPASDIALILKIQSSLEKIIEKGYPFNGIRIVDWESAWLRGAKLQRAQLQGAFLQNAQLQGANLDHAHLQGADLRHAQLQGADLWDAQLQGAYLRYAQLQGADLWDAQLQGADLWDAQLQEADLRDAQLQGVFSSQTPHETVGESRLNYEARFEVAISRRAGQKTEVDSVVFEGKMTIEHLSEIEEKMDLGAKFWEQGSYMKNRKAELEQLLKTLEKEHQGNKIIGRDFPVETLKTKPCNIVGSPAIKGVGTSETESIKINKYLIMCRGAESGTYTRYEANKWIAEYKKAMGLEE